MLAPTYKPEPKEPWSAEQLSTFLAGSVSHRLHPLWLFLIATGCRLGEAVALRWEDTDLAAGTVTIRRAAQKIDRQWVVTTPKTRAGVRSIALPQEAVAALRRQRALQAERRLKAGTSYQDHGLVFANETGGYQSFTTVEWALAQYCKRLGLPPVTPHGLRHLHASLLLAQGLPVPAVSARLGHANPGVTMTVYAHYIGQNDDAAAKAISKALAGGSLQNSL